MIKRRCWWLMASLTEWHPETQVHEMITKILGEVHQGIMVPGSGGSKC